MGPAFCVSIVVVATCIISCIYYFYKSYDNIVKYLYNSNIKNDIEILSSDDLSNDNKIKILYKIVHKNNN